MDGVLPTANKVSSTTTAQFAGILYAEDFDDPIELDGSLSKPENEPPPPAITQADIDAACAEAVRAAQIEWQSSQEQARQNTIASLATLLVEIKETTERVSLEVAEGISATILSMVNGLLPHFSQQHGPAEVRALLGQLLPVIRSHERVTVRVHADLVSMVKRDVSELDPNLSAMIDVVAAPIQLGDVKVAWENGSMARDVRLIAQAIQDALGQLGLHQTVEAPAKRTMAYAD